MTKLNKGKMKLFLISFILFFFFLSSAKASVFTVCSSGCDSNTVQGGINLAADGDQVSITDSREYNETVTVNRSITLTGVASTSPTIFQDGPSITGFTVVNVTSGNSVLSKIKVKYNGTGTGMNGVTVNQA